MQGDIAKRDSIREQVREYILAAFLRSRGDGELRDDEDLLLVLNSLQLLRMVIELESRFRISIENSDLSPENLGTVERIAAFIEGRQC